jgi:hypothetical protein
MNNKAFTLLLICSLVLSGCYRQEMTEETTSLSETSVEITEETTTACKIPEEYEWQLAVILDNSDLWYPPDPDVYDCLWPSMFAVTDLDEDGYLELFKCREYDNAPLTSIWIYEVTEEGEMVELVSSLEEPGSEYYSSDYPDVPLTNFDIPVNAYYDDDGTLLLQVSNMEFTERWNGLHRYGTMYIQDNTYYFEEEFSYGNYIENDRSTVRYYDRDGAEITASDYLDLSTEYESRAEKEVNFGWFISVTAENIKTSFLTYFE